MKFLPTLALAMVAATATSPDVRRSESVAVRSVIDGDTIDVDNVGRVRLLGIDAPELGRGFDTTAPFAREARDRLASLVLHRFVRLEWEPGVSVDVYNRHLAYIVREDGVFVNAVLVRDGLARISARVPLARLSELQEAEREARLFRRGMWGETPQAVAERHSVRPPKVAPKSGGRYTAKSGSAGKKRRTTSSKRRRPTSTDP